MPSSSSLINRFQLGGSSDGSGGLLGDTDETKRMDGTAVEWLQTGQFESIITDIVKCPMARTNPVRLDKLSATWPSDLQKSVKTETDLIRAKIELSEGSKTKYNKKLVGDGGTDPTDQVASVVTQLREYYTEKYSSLLE